MTGTSRKRVQERLRKNSGTATTFKYYIHDTPKGYSLELLGPFFKHAIGELSCCWNTAKTTSINRALILDLRGVTSIDDEARRWLLSMNDAGAKFFPESFLSGAYDAENQDRSGQSKASFFCRLTHAFRVAA